MNGDKNWYHDDKFADGYKLDVFYKTVKKTMNYDKKTKKNNNKKADKKTNKKTDKKTDKKTNKKVDNKSVDTKKQETKNNQTGIKANTENSIGKINCNDLVNNSPIITNGLEGLTERNEYINKLPNSNATVDEYKYVFPTENNKYSVMKMTNEERQELIRYRTFYAVTHNIDKKKIMSDYSFAVMNRMHGFPLTDSQVEAEIMHAWFEGYLGDDEVAEKLVRAKKVNSALNKFNKKEEMTLEDINLLAENGGRNFTGGDIYKTIDFLAKDNPNYVSARDAFFKAKQKLNNGEELSQKERADAKYFVAYDAIKQSINNEMIFGRDPKRNAEEIDNIFQAIDLYNNAIYKGDSINRSLYRMKLYMGSGTLKFFQDSINSGVILFSDFGYLTGISDEKASDILKNTAKSEYEIANDAIAHYFNSNNKKINKFVQDATTGLSYNVLPMLLAGVSGGASLAATGLSVFGGSYNDAVMMAPDASEWQYWLYAGMNTSISVCTEKFLGGDKNIYPNISDNLSAEMFNSLSEKISSKALLKGAYILSNSTGEAFEESIQGLISPMMQSFTLGIDVPSLFSVDPSEQKDAVKNALYDGLVGFASAGVTTGLLGQKAIQSTEQKQTVGEYYKKSFNELNTDIENVALYLKEISDKTSALQQSADRVLNGDKSNAAVADMMINGFDRCLDAQEFVYRKIGERLNENNKYTAYSLVREYNRIRDLGIKLPDNINKTYQELINVDEGITKERFNYLVGRLSTTMDAVLPRASIANEVVKKISNELENKAAHTDIKENKAAYSENLNNFKENITPSVENSNNLKENITPAFENSNNLKENIIPSAENLNDFSKNGTLSDEKSNRITESDLSVNNDLNNVKENAEHSYQKNIEIDENEFVKGLWNDDKGYDSETIAKDVENSRLKNVENSNDNVIIEEVKELTLDNITKDILKTKPPYSRNPKSWIKDGGKIEIDSNNNWIYTDWDGLSVKYVNGYPDYRGAGVVVQMVDIGEFKNRGSDAKKANRLAPNGPRKKENVWHHSQDGYTMEEIKKEIHQRFTHMGGIARLKGIIKNVL